MSLLLSEGRIPGSLRLHCHLSSTRHSSGIKVSAPYSASSGVGSGPHLAFASRSSGGATGFLVTFGWN